ncbi:hypothetical protein OpiT1DRAFT_03845 [Opitutaceae bacterium TAV1]|nr:hypothetical protein OpiT1DRAFT_03845 [Opitutaceae bacterium TAV1]
MKKQLLIFLSLCGLLCGQQKIEIVGTGTLPPGVHNRVQLVSISEDAAAQIGEAIGGGGEWQPLNVNLTDLSNLATIPLFTSGTGNMIGMVVDSNRLRRFTMSSNAVANSVMWRRGDGQSLIVSPTLPDAVANKAYVDGRTPQPAYAIFTIPIGPGFFDFELKATLSNFGEHSPFTDLYLYYHSPDPARTLITGQTGPVPTVYFTDTGWTDKRRWRKQTANQSIWAMRSNSGALIPAAIVVVPVDATISPTNAGLIWSYQRITATDYEDIWYPIVPVWSAIAPTP